MDAGARGRRLLQRREYAAKVSGSEDRVPDDIRDWYNLDGKDLFDENRFADMAIRALDKSQDVYNKITTKKGGGKNLLGKGLDFLFKAKNPGGQYGGAANPGKGTFGEANAEQMKAMHDAKMKKKEDDMKKKKKVDEAKKCWDGYKKTGTQKLFGKTYNRCEKEEYVNVDERKNPDGKHRAKVLGRDGQPMRMKAMRNDTGSYTYDQGLIKAVMDKRKQMAKKKKETKEEVQLEAKKSCGEGEYYCHDRKKCMPIPKGAKVGKGGMLVKEDDMKGMSVKSGHKRPTKSGAGMTAKGVAAYRRRNPGSKLKTAVTTKPSKLKKGSKAANRRKSYCARSAGQMKKFPKAAKDPNSRLRQARRRWNC